MKARKIFFSLSAIALTIHALWEILREIPSFWDWYNNVIWGNPLRVEIFWLPYTWLFLGAVVLAASAFLIRKPDPQPVPNWHKFSTYALSVSTLFVTGYAVIHSIHYYGVNFLYAPTWMRVFIDIVSCAWLWMLTVRPNVPELPRALRSVIGTGIGLIVLLWVFQLISGIAYLTTGHILMFHSHAFGNWLRYLVPTVCLCSYSLYLLNKWPSRTLQGVRQTPNSHCVPGSFFERAYPAMRIVTLIGAGLILVSIYLTSIWFHHFNDRYTNFAVNALAITIVISWFLCTFMAFFQLPNPRGYKIFNWICLAIHLCLPVGLLLVIFSGSNVMLDTISEILCVVGLFSIIAYILFTLIRVILYIPIKQ